MPEAVPPSTDTVTVDGEVKYPCGDWGTAHTRYDRRPAPSVGCPMYGSNRSQSASAAWLSSTIASSRVSVMSPKAADTTTFSVSSTKRSSETRKSKYPRPRVCPAGMTTLKSDTGW